MALMALVKNCADPFPDLDFRREANCTVNSDHLHSQIFDTLNELRSEELLCDVELVAGNKTLRAHRAVLAASIPYFKCMFTTNMLEAAEKQIQIPNIDHDTLELLVLYAYGRNVTITAVNVVAVMIAADFLQLHHVAETCATLICEQLLDSTNAIAVKKLFYSLSFSSAVEFVDRFINENFTLVSTSKAFLELPAHDLAELLCRDELQADSEDGILEAAARWADYGSKKTERQCYALTIDLVYHIRLHLLGNFFFGDRATPHPNTRGSMLCRGLVDKQKCYLRTSELHRSPHFLATEYRHFSVYLIGRDSRHDPFTIEKLDPHRMQRTFLNSSKYERFDYGVAVTQDKIYAIGGRNAARVVLGSVDCYDITRNVWTVAPPLIEARYNLVARSLDDKLYVCGGRDCYSSLSSVEVYDLDDNAWHVGPPMNEPRYNASAVVLDGFIYVMGGCDVNSRTVSTVERFSRRTGYWENVISMITQRQSFGAVALNGKIYVCGGLNEHGELRDAECFDPRTWRWRSLPMMPIASAVSASWSSNSEICAVGASNPDGSYDMQVYNIKAKRWKIVKSYRKCK